MICQLSTLPSAEAAGGLLLQFPDALHIDASSLQLEKH
jgi:hypothetical protein